jgi:FKBP-type peptidyl-prolyl cis-trans isomerase
MNKSNVVVLSIGAVLLAAILGLAMWSKHQAEQGTASSHLKTSITPTPKPSKEAQVIMDATTPTTLPNGLQIHDTQVGTGTEAKEGSTITVKYSGSLDDGTVFDSTDKHGGDPVTFSLAKGSLIDGWVEGIPGMKVGGKRTLVIPSALGYGSQAQSSIPANSTLHFDIELIDVK